MDLDSLRESVTTRLDETHSAREVGLRNCRTIIRSSANSIRAFHRGEADVAAGLVADAGALLAETVAVLADHPEILHAGFVHDAAKEYAEAVLTAALASGGPLPSPDELGVTVPAYLNGLGEAVGELRRRMLDLLRAGDLGTAESTLATMDDVVETLATVDYPDGMTGGLRRTTDVARALVERSRSDLTTTIVQERLRSSLERS